MRETSNLQPDGDAPKGRNPFLLGCECIPYLGHRDDCTTHPAFDRYQEGRMDYIEEDEHGVLHITYRPDPT